MVLFFFIPVFQFEQHIGDAMTMFGDIKASVLPVLESFFTDTELARTIIYRRYVGETFSSELKYTVASYSDVTIPAIRMVHTARSAANAPGNVQAGQVLYMIRAEDAPDGMSLKDLIIDGDETLSVSVINDIFGIVFEITVEASNVTR